MLLALISPAANQPTGAGFDLLLLAHVVFVVIGLLGVVISGVEAARVLALGPDVPPSPTLLRYYAPGANWAGRMLYGVPVLGVLLLLDSHGAFGFHDLWVMLGAILWVGGIAIGEGLLWPSERRLQGLVNGGVMAEAAGGGEVATRAATLRRTALVACGCSAALVAMIIAATVVMVGQP